MKRMFFTLSMISTQQGILDVTQHCIHPFEVRMSNIFPPALRDNDDMPTYGISDSSESVGLTRMYSTSCNQTGFKILSDLCTANQGLVKLDSFFRHDGNPTVFSRFHYANVTVSIAESCG